MKFLNHKNWIVILLVLMAVSFSANANAVSYDLKTDWSNTNNPNGLWAFYQGTTLLPHQSDFDRNHVYVINQQAWANAQFDNTVIYNNVGHIPVWMQVLNDGEWNADVKVGDIIMHPSSVYSSLPLGEGYVKWTSNLTGSVQINGNVWWADLNNQLPDRSVNWYLYFNSTLLASGNVSHADGDKRDNPVTFGVFTVDVKVGDVIIFEAVAPPSILPWFIGVNLTLNATPVRNVSPILYLLLDE